MAVEVNTRRRYSSRKFVTAMIWGVLWSLMLLAGRLTEAIYETLMMISVGGYLVADVAEKRLVPPDAR